MSAIDKLELNKIINKIQEVLDVNKHLTEVIKQLEKTLLNIKCENKKCEEEIEKINKKQKILEMDEKGVIKSIKICDEDLEKNQFKIIELSKQVSDFKLM